MKTLVLFRHAKSAHPAGCRDFDRTLADRGRRDAPAAGRELARRAVHPDVVVSSPAARARETVLAALAAAGLPDRFETEPAVYEAAPEALLEVVQSLPETAGSALLVGHNPGLEQLLANLAPGQASELPTAALVCLQLEADSWSGVHHGCGRAAWRWTPRD